MSRIHCTMCMDLMKVLNIMEILYIIKSILLYSKSIDYANNHFNNSVIVSVRNGYTNIFFEKFQK